ncbi:hypothetical protein D3C71_2174090 [compost metagenome]
MLTLTVIDDVFDNNQFLMLFVKRYAQNILVVCFIASKNFFVHPGNSGRCIQ